jgi:hypothetical protein
MTHLLDHEFEQTQQSLKQGCHHLVIQPVVACGPPLVLDQRQEGHRSNYLVMRSQAQAQGRVSDKESHRFENCQFQGC